MVHGKMLSLIQRLSASLLPGVNIAQIYQSPHTSQSGSYSCIDCCPFGHVPNSVLGKINDSNMEYLHS